jgi:glycosyltransferase involved in cell wall biosynthesis
LQTAGTWLVKTIMRVALLTNFIPPYRRKLYEELSARCSAFQILLSAPTESDREWIPNWGALPVRLQRTLSVHTARKHPHSFTQPLTVHIPYDTIPELIRFKPDVVISAELGMRTLQAAMYCSLFSRSGLVIWAKLSEVSEQGRGRLRHCLRRLLLPRARSVIVNGQSGARYLSRFGVKSSQCFFAPCTPDLAPYLSIPASRPSRIRRRLLYAGMLTELKGVIPFLDHLSAWASAHPEDSVEIDMVGNGPLRERILALPRPRNLAIRVLGHVQYDQMPSFYAGAGILVFPTLSDEWGMVVPEAMASGMPVLGSLFSQAVEELITPGRTGWTFRPTHPQEVRAALARALSASDAELNDMGALARQQVSCIPPAVIADRIMSAAEYALRSRNYAAAVSAIRS